MLLCELLFCEYFFHLHYELYVFINETVAVEPSHPSLMSFRNKMNETTEWMGEE